jgi:hypothetical protein
MKTNIFINYMAAIAAALILFGSSCKPLGGELPENGDMNIKKRIPIYFVDSSGHNIVGFDSGQINPYRVLFTYHNYDDSNWSSLHWKESDSGLWIHYIFFDMLVYTSEDYKNSRFDHMSRFRFDAKEDTLRVEKHDDEHLNIFWNKHLVTSLIAPDTVEQTVSIIR